MAGHWTFDDQSVCLFKQKMFGLTSKIGHKIQAGVKVIVYTCGLSPTVFIYLINSTMKNITWYQPKGSFFNTRM